MSNINETTNSVHIDMSDLLSELSDLDCEEEKE